MTAGINGCTSRARDTKIQVEKVARPDTGITLAAHSGKRNVTVWHPSVYLSVPSAYSRDSTGGSMRRGQRTYLHTCYN